MEQPVFDITNFNITFMSFYLALGFIVTQIYCKLPKENAWLAYVLAALIFVAVWHETRFSSRMWVIVSWAEMIVGGAMYIAYQRYKPKHPTPE